MQERQWKRSNKLPQPRFQLRLVGAVAGFCVLTLVAHTILISRQLMQFAADLPSGGGHLAEALPSMLVQGLGLSVAIVLPPVVLVGIHMTFRIAGPLFRFERHLESLARDEEPGVCSIREGDDLQDFCDTLNAGIEGAKREGARSATAADDSSQERPAA